MNDQDYEMLPLIKAFCVQFFRKKTGSKINLQILTFNEDLAICIAQQELGDDWTFQGFKSSEDNI